MYTPKLGPTTIAASTSFGHVSALSLLGMSPSGTVASPQGACGLSSSTKLREPSIGEVNRASFLPSDGYFVIEVPVRSMETLR